MFEGIRLSGRGCADIDYRLRRSSSSGIAHSSCPGDMLNMTRPPGHECCAVPRQVGAFMILVKLVRVCKTLHSPLFRTEFGSTWLFVTFSPTTLPQKMRVSSGRSRGRGCDTAAPSSAPHPRVRKGQGEPFAFPFSNANIGRRACNHELLCGKNIAMPSSAPYLMMPRFANLMTLSIPFCARAASTTILPSTIQYGAGYDDTKVG